MKSFITLVLVVSGIISVNAQSSNINEAYRSNKFMEKISTPKGQLTFMQTFREMLITMQLSCQQKLKTQLL